MKILMDRAFKKVLNETKIICGLSYSVPITAQLPFIFILLCLSFPTKIPHNHKNQNALIRSDK